MPLEESPHPSEPSPPRSRLGSSMSRMLEPHEQSLYHDKVEELGQRGFRLRYLRDLDFCFIREFSVCSKSFAMFKDFF